MKPVSDTMVDAIALSSPSGRMSKRARKAALRRLHDELFPGWTREDFVGRVEQPTERERDLRQAAFLRGLAARGLRPRANLKEAIRLETKHNLVNEKEQNK